MTIIFRSSYIILFLIDLLISKKKYNSIFSSITLFGVVWCIFPFLSSFGLIGMYKPEIIAHELILLSNLIFMIVYSLSAKRSFDFDQNEDIGVVNERALIWGNLCCTVLLVPSAIRSFGVIASMGFAYLRSDAGTAMTSNSVLQAAYTSLVMPFILASACLVISEFTISRKRPNKSLLLLIVVNTMLHSIIFAARAVIVKIILYMFFALFFAGHHEMKKMSKKNRWILIIVSIVMLLFTAYITSGRMEKNYASYSFFDSILLYYIGPFSLLSVYLVNPAIGNLWDASYYLYGKATFGFVLNFFDTIKYFFESFFGRGDYQGSDYIIVQAVKQYYRIGDGLASNSVTTAIYPFLRDFGIIGLIVGFAFVAFVIAKIESKEKATLSIKYRAIYIFLLYIVFKTGMNYEATSTSVFVTVILILVFCKDSRSKIRVVFGKKR